MKHRSCFVSNSSSSSFIIDNFCNDWIKAQVKRCCLRFVERKVNGGKPFPPDRRKQMMKRISAFLDNPKNVIFVNFERNLTERQKELRIRRICDLACIAPSDFHDAVKRSGKKLEDGITAMVDAENALYDEFGCAKDEITPWTDESILEALAKELGTPALRLS